MHSSGILARDRLGAMIEGDLRVINNGGERLRDARDLVMVRRLWDFVRYLIFGI